MRKNDKILLVTQRSIIMTEFSVFYQRNNATHTIPFCLIQTPKHILSLHLNKILFIESRQKHSFIHTATETITLASPLYRILSQLPKNTFIQIHRSFIINLENISHIDKSKDPWIVSFHGSEKIAFVSRSFRQQVIESLLSSD